MQIYEQASARHLSSSTEYVPLPHRPRPKLPLHNLPSSQQQHSNSNSNTTTEQRSTDCCSTSFSRFRKCKYLPFLLQTPGPSPDCAVSLWVELDRKSLERDETTGPPCLTRNPRSTVLAPPQWPTYHLAHLHLVCWLRLRPCRAVNGESSNSKLAWLQ
ncbi:hypothetical protein CC85DRAFT_44933 [Cutaneotrichosporon oleaginosum]|uniref:Uncharacterized protein n=1 Tax=Cutaneotrichosporon oleaginosum TaxID=879819 RepID=A0A0J0XR93_9TREE|nr:uncharacterized protein CC85DRAFT_44933 [Cutaneotrichosporon oleaginosum]KLT43618.1 hypothetical protein CC85DRAFT_44933 [Cutaneotrichosporon oleaginosum]TXT12714.1 hypothetical protein COLE_03124 [Cutaneotrichosporon oleaginosum]